VVFLLNRGCGSGSQILSFLERQDPDPHEK